jgi:uncharacterized phage protein (TIGR01671 family)
MRTIKFRGKALPQNKWLYGDLLTSDDYKVAVIRDHNSCVEQRVDTDTVGQLTGLFDINGKEIYEGDVIETIPAKARLEVIYNQNDAEFIGYSDNGRLCFANKYITYKVIGNIHDNPELLSKSK